MVSSEACPSVLSENTGFRLKLGNVLKSIFSRSGGRGLLAANVTNSKILGAVCPLEQMPGSAGACASVHQML